MVEFILAVSIWPFYGLVIYAACRVRRSAFDAETRSRRRRRRAILYKEVYSRNLLIGGAAAATLGASLLAFGVRAPLVPLAILLDGGMLTAIVGGTIILRKKLDFQAKLRWENWRICPECLYSLEGLADEGRCPECGYAFSTESLEREWRSLF